MEYYNSIGKGKIKTNDILIVKDGATTGKVSFVSENFPLQDAAINEHVFRVELDDKKIHPKYCFYYLVSDEGQKNILSDFRGATVGGISKAILDKVQIPLPPLPIQKRIAEILDAADALQRKDQQLLKKYEELAQAIFIDMFGDPVKNEKGWGRKVATRYYEVRGRVGWKGYKKTDLRQKGAIVLGATHVTNNGEIDLTKVVFLSEEKFIESPEIVVQKDDLIFVQRGNTIGKVALIRNDLGEATINPVVLIIRPVNANPLFLLYLLLNKEQNRELVSSNSGSAQPMITQEFMRKYVFIDVAKEEQEKFAERIKLVEVQKGHAQISYSNSYNLFQTLIQKAFRGELVAE